jgi:hypothetical protein
MEYVVDSEYMYRVSNLLEISMATGGGRRRRERLSVAHVMYRGPLGECGRTTYER